MTTRANVKSRQGLYFRMKNNYFITIYYVIKIRNLPVDKNNPVVSGHSLKAEEIILRVMSLSRQGKDPVPSREVDPSSNQE